jgi:hypothetical protein
MLRSNHREEMPQVCSQLDELRCYSLLVATVCKQRVIHNLAVDVQGECLEVCD